MLHLEGQWNKWLVTKLTQDDDGKRNLGKGMIRNSVNPERRTEGRIIRIIRRRSTGITLRRRIPIHQPGLFGMFLDSGGVAPRWNCFFLIRPAHITSRVSHRAPLWTECKVIFHWWEAWYLTSLFQISLISSYSRHSLGYIIRVCYLSSSVTCP